MKHSSRWIDTKSGYDRSIYSGSDKAKYYKELLICLRKNKIKITDSILEVGGGEFPFCHFIHCRKKVVVDPFCKPADQAGLIYYQIPIEDFVSRQRFETVICLNVIDHVDNVNKTLNNLRNLVVKGGEVVCILNTYENGCVKTFFDKFSHWIDPPHLHHFTRDDFISLMRANGFSLKLFIKQYDQYFRSQENSGYIKKIQQMISEPRYLLRTPIIFLLKLLFRQPFRPACLYVFIRD